MVMDVEVPNLPLERLGPLIGNDRLASIQIRGRAFKENLHGRRIWNVNSTAAGGGVAEMLRSLVGYTRQAGIDARWVVISGDPEFFRITKRLHNQLHGLPGDGGPLAAAESAHYVSVMEQNLPGLRERIRPGDVVLLHDPQTAGFVETLNGLGAIIIWRCHIGTNQHNEWTESAWNFLRPFISTADAFIFSRRDYVPEWIDPSHVSIIPPSIDPFSPKNQEIDDVNVQRILATIGLLAPESDHEPGVFTGYDGLGHHVRDVAEIISDATPLDPAIPLVVQVSRWDGLKDMEGVMVGFAEGVAPRSDAHLALIGASVGDVSDDPEGAEVLARCTDTWEHLPSEIRARIHLVSLPMDDLDQNAAMVNAIQRHATLIVQKSLVEGFGITVAEGLWKSKPMVASAVGGIQDQIVDGAGVLLNDPYDLVAYGDAVASLLLDPNEMKRLGQNAHEHILATFIGDTHLLRYVDLIESLLQP